MEATNFILTSPGFPVNASSRRFENTGPGQIFVTLILCSYTSGLNPLNQPCKKINITHMNLSDSERLFNAAEYNIYGLLKYCTTK